MDEEPILDDSRLSQLASLDPDGRTGLLKELLERFEVTMAQREGQLVAAGSDRRKWKDVLHATRGTASNLGASRLVRHLEETERLVDRGGDPGASLATLQAEFRLAVEAVRRRIPRFENPPDPTTPSRD